MRQHEYIGRFAPSPTGLLHMGSLITAMASYCEAKSQCGQWLVRMEDLDPPRSIAGADQHILACLTAYGFEYRQPVLHQSQADRQQAYQKALKQLIDMGAVYYCPCSRAELKASASSVHLCREQAQITDKAHSIKIKVPNQFMQFNDAIQGQQSKNLERDCGDFVIKRKDQLFSYQLAVVVDDHYQNVNHIVRGMDLIDSSFWQMYLNKLLGYAQAQYAHIPLLVNAQGQKLSKQTFAPELDNTHILATLLTAYAYLNQKPLTTRPKHIADFWQQAINNWNLDNVLKIPTITV